MQSLRKALLRPLSNRMSKKVVVGMSGGVDSSVAALLLKQQGYDVIGVFMKNWEDEDGECPAQEDYADVSSVCAKLDIPYYTVNFAKEYYERVFQYFLTEYERGRTPNPDVLCNSEIKFKAFLDYALEVIGAECIATGHYVRRREKDGKWQLLKAVDESKDQSYFLCQLNQRQLAKSLFPVGELKKNEVRKIAEENGLRTADKKDSTGICFIGERKFREFLSKYLPNQRGIIRDIHGEAVGEHIGLMYYTLGQRRGLGIGGRGSGERWYVVEKDLQRNELIVVQGEHPALYSQGLVAKEAEWIEGSAPSSSFECTVKYRYRQPDRKAKVTAQGNTFFVEFFEPQKAVCPGQYVVFYDKEVCLGGAEIERAIHAS